MDIRNQTSVYLEGYVIEYDNRMRVTDKIIANITKEIESKRKRMDVGDIGANSLSFPSGEHWTQEIREGYNRAIQDISNFLNGVVREIR